MILMGSGLPLSGLSADAGHALPIVAEALPQGPGWWTGGAYGPEGGAAATVLLVLVSGLSGLFPRRSPERGATALRPVWSDRPLRLAAKDDPETP
jgi:hypothetical protein